MLLDNSCKLHDKRKVKYGQFWYINMLLIVLFIKQIAIYTSEYAIYYSIEDFYFAIRRNIHWTFRVFVLRQYQPD